MIGFELGKSLRDSLRKKAWNAIAQDSKFQPDLRCRMNPSTPSYSQALRSPVASGWKAPAYMDSDDSSQRISINRRRLNPHRQAEAGSLQQGAIVNPANA